MTGGNWEKNILLERASNLGKSPTAYFVNCYPSPKQDVADSIGCALFIIYQILSPFPSDYLASIGLQTWRGAVSIPRLIL